MWGRALLVATQSFLFGYTFSCLNSCLVTGDDNDGGSCYHDTDSSCPKGTIYNNLNLTTFEAQAATSLCVLGAWIGSYLGNAPCELYGRRKTLLWNNIFFIIGAILASLGNFWTLFIGRFITGIGVGVASVVSPVLLSEIASKETKGTITTLCQLGVTFAIFFASALGYGLVTYVDRGWQWMQAFGAVPAVATLVLYKYVPESPKWLLAFGDKASKDSDEADNRALNKNYGSSSDGTSKKSNNKSARDCVYLQLKDLRPSDWDVEKEIEEMQEEADKESKGSGDEVVSWADVLEYKQGVIIGCGLMFGQALTGINSVIFYSTTIFGLAGFNEAIIGSCTVGLVNFGITLIANQLIDTMGRKVLLNIGTTIMTCSLVCLSVVLLSPIEEHLQGWLAVLAILLYIAGFAVGLGAVVWVVMSEVMPTRVRSKAMSLFLNINWASNLVVGALTLTAIDSLGGERDSMDDDEKDNAEKKGVAYLYIIFAGVCVLTLMFMAAYVPETKGTSPEEVKKPLLSKEDIGEDEDQS